MEPETTAPSKWSPAQRILFRFAFCYFVLSVLPFPAAAVWDTDPVYEAYDNDKVAPSP